MKRLVLLLALVALPAVAFGQNRWSSGTAFPIDSLKIAAGNGGHGIAVDPDGKVWFQPFSGTLTITFPDTVVVNGTKRKTLSANQIFVYNADGTPASFSPVTYLANGSGVRVDTLGYFYGGMAPATATAPARQRFETRSGRGLRAGNDGNIYASQFNTVFRINYKTGAFMGAARDIYGGNSLSAVAIDGFGSVYTTAVGQAAGRPIRIYSDDLTTLLDPSAVAAPAPGGFSRSLEVNRAGTRLYFSSFTAHAIHLYSRASEQDPFVQTPDTLLKGFDSESLTIHPVTGALWASAGSANDLPNKYPGFRSAYTYQPQTWYAFDQTQLSKTNSNPTPLDSIKWTGGGVGRPRGLAFNSAGNVAYATQFSQNAPVVLKFTFQPVGVEPVDGVPAGFALQGSYPNPFRGETRVRFSLDQASHVSLKVYDVIGREVATLVDETLAAGGYASPFDGANLPAGTYFYRLSARGRTLSGAMTLAK